MAVPSAGERAPRRPSPWASFERTNAPAASGGDALSTVDWRLLTVAFLGVCSAVVYLLMTLQISFLEYFPGEGFGIFFVQVFPDEWFGIQLFFVASAGLFVAYVTTLYLLREPTRGLQAVLFVMPFVFVGILTFMYPPFSTDFVHNVSDARTLWLFGDNPMVTPPEANPFPVEQIWGHEPAPYGPLWFILLFPVVLAGDSAEVAVHILKTYTALYYLGSAFLVFLIARRLTPGRETFAFALYAWNPFVVMRAVGDGHNDVVMFFFVLLAVWAMVSDRWRWVLPALAAGALIKYVPILLIPPLLLGGYWAATNRVSFLRENLVGGMLAVALVVVTFVPFLEEGVFDQVINGQAERFAHSIWLALQVQLDENGGLSYDDSFVWARRAGQTFFALAYLGLLYALWRSQRRLVDAIACGALMMLALSVGLSWFMPWYFLWSLTLLVLVPGRWSAALVVALSIGGMCPELLSWYGPRWSYFVDHTTTYLLAIVLLIFGAAFLVLAAAWLVGRKTLLVEATSRGQPYRSAARFLRTTT